jgi:hypothetical protein
VFFVQGKQINLGAPAEVSCEDSAKRHRGRPANVGHFRDEDGPTHFLRIVFKLTLGQLPIPSNFIYWFGPILSNIVVLSNTGCSWRMTTRKDDDKAFIDQGWEAFAIAHQLKIGQFHTFKDMRLPCGHLPPHPHWGHDQVPGPW